MAFKWLADCVRKSSLADSPYIGAKPRRAVDLTCIAASDDRSAGNSVPLVVGDCSGR